MSTGRRWTAAGAGFGFGGGVLSVGGGRLRHLLREDVPLRGLSGEVEARRRPGELLLDPIEVGASGGVVLVPREDLQELLAGSREVARLEALAAPFEGLRDSPVALGHLLAGLLDPSDGLGVVDVDQEDPRPDLDGLLPIADPRGLVALRQERLDLVLSEWGSRVRRPVPWRTSRTAPRRRRSPQPRPD